ncbi:MAG: DUF4269 domain-containing protein [Anaerolineales bacterium]|nr:DUF4269 domain-containing protein [Anaerolineales bacterium]
MTQPDIHSWYDLDYLARGNLRQRAAYQVLDELQVMQVLAQFNPTLVGTLPIGIDIPGSDLDIICDTDDLNAFSIIVKNKYGEHEDFHLKIKTIHHLPAAIASFSYKEFPIQIFAQPCPVEQQNAFRHMVVEARLLEIGGLKARQEIHQLKLRGLKTEPAFAHYFQLTGNPYARLLELSMLSNEDLIKALHP